MRRTNGHGANERGRTRGGGGGEGRDAHHATRRALIVVQEIVQLPEVPLACDGGHDEYRSRRARVAPQNGEPPLDPRVAVAERPYGDDADEDAIEEFRLVSQHLHAHLRIRCHFCRIETERHGANRGVVGCHRCARRRARLHPFFSTRQFFGKKRGECAVFLVPPARVRTCVRWHVDPHLRRVFPCVQAVLSFTSAISRRLVSGLGCRTRGRPFFRMCPQNPESRARFGSRNTRRRRRRRILRPCTKVGLG